MESSWKTLRDIIPEALIHDEIKSGPKITLKNGFEIIGWNAKGHQKMASLNLSWFWIDEANEEGVDLTIYNQLCGRLRNAIGNRKGWLTGNPAGRNWLWERFYAHLEGGKKFPNHAGFQMNTRQNIYLPAGYEDRLREFYPAEWIELYLEGSFAVLEGMILSEWRQALHLVEPFAIPDTWPRFRGLDHGLVNPTACLWAATDFEGNLIWYREHYRRSAIPEENAEDILRASGTEVISWTAIDPSTMAVQSAGGTSEKIIDQYRRAGLNCEPGNHDVRASIARFKSYLQPDQNRKFPSWHPRRGESGAPGMYVFSDLKAFRWEIESWRWKDVRPGATEREKPITKNDHLIAAARYLIMRGPQPAVEGIRSTLYDRFLAISNEMKGDPSPGDEEYLNAIGNEHLTGTRRRRPLLLEA